MGKKKEISSVGVSAFLCAMSGTSFQIKQTYLFRPIICKFSIFSKLAGKKHIPALLSSSNDSKLIRKFTSMGTMQQMY